MRKPSKNIYVYLNTATKKNARDTRKNNSIQRDELSFSNSLAFFPVVVVAYL